MTENHYCSSDRCHRTTPHEVLDASHLKCTACGVLKDRVKNDMWMGSLHSPFIPYKFPDAPAQLSRHPRILYLDHPQRGSVVPLRRESGRLVALRPQDP